MAAERLRNCGLFVALTVLAVAANGEMTTVTYQVSSDSDDGYAWSATDQNTTAAYLMIGDGKVYDPPYYMSGMRFADVGVPRSAVITEAHLRIRSMSEATGWQVYGVIEAEATDDAADFASRYIGAAGRTTASVDWDHKFGWVANTWQISGDISAVVQEVTDRPGWSSGGAMAVFYNTRRTSGKSRKYASFAASPAYAPILEITYQTYAISGHVRTADGAAIEGVAISAGADIEDTLTDSGGYYELKVPPGWSGTVTLTKTDWGFDPPSRAYSSIAADQNDQDYTGIQPKISGYVTDSEGGGVPAVAVSADNGGGSDTTDEAGYYEITVAYNWSGTVTPVKAGWDITPADWTYNGVVADQTNQNYTAFQPRISGYVRDLSAIGMEGVLVSADGGGSDTTDGNGYYELTVPYNWSGTVTPVKAGWDINPASWTYNNVVADQNNQNYTAFQPRISGYVRDLSASGMEGVLVSADNGGGSDTTDANGYYAFAVPYNWSGTVTPNKAGWGFTPANKSYSTVTANQANQDYTGFQPKIGGYVRDLGAIGMEGVLVSADGGGGSDTTDANGYYELTVPYNWSGAVTPAKAGWGFNPPSKSYSNVISNQTSQDYTGFQPTISGHVRDANSTGMEDVLVSANNGGGSDTTDANGYYQITVPYAWSGMVTPEKVDWGFSPSNRPYANITANQADHDYTGFQPEISGHIRDANGTGLEGVLVSADGGGGSHTTDVTGYYDITVPYNWSGTVTPSKADWGFTPGSRAYSNIVSDQVNQDYSVFQPKISGYVSDRDGAPVADAAVSADNGGGSGITDVGGYYEVTVPYGWSGTVTATKAGWDMSPASRVYSDVIADQTSQDYSAFQPRISGYVTEASGGPAVGVTLSADAGGGSDISDATGYYEITVTYNWSGTVTPDKAAWGFDPLSRNYSNVTTDETNQDYTAFQPVISGYVTDTNGAACEGVVVATNDANGSDVTDSNGYYEFAVPYNWSGTVTPQKLFWFFEPASRTYSNLIADAANQDYTGVVGVSISGKVVNFASIGIAGVEVSADNGGGSDITQGSGFYELAVLPGWSGTVTPNETGRTFEPADRSYTDVTVHLTGQDYVSLPLTVFIDGSGGFPTIQAAIDAAFHGDQVIVGPGTYMGQGNTNILFLGKAITVRSVDPQDACTVAATVIDCNLTSSGFHFDYGEGPDSVLDGFTITSAEGFGIGCWEGSPIIRNCVIRDCLNGGIGLGTSSALISDCIITGNGTPESEWSYGGGISCGEYDYYGYCDATVSNCIISYNSAWTGGGISCLVDVEIPMSVKISDCTFIGNYAARDAGAIEGCAGPITDCTFIGNVAGDDGGALRYCSGPIRGCTFTGNEAADRGGAVYYCWGPISNCVFSGNRAGSEGGAMFGFYYYEGPYGGSSISNCTICWNSAGSYGGGISAAQSGPTVTDCVLWGNTDSTGAGELAQIRSGSPRVSFSCIQDDDPNDANIPFGGADVNNIDDYPKFIRDASDGGDGWGDDPCTPDVNEAENDDFGDLHLLMTSPCMDAGDPVAWIGPDAVDIDGEPRIMGAAVDMGADEFPVPLLAVTIPRGGEVWVCGSWHEIRWQSVVFEGMVDILLSTDGGGSTEPVESGMPDTGSYLWNLPTDVDSSQCVIWVVPSVPDPNVICIESGLFTIHPDAPGPAAPARWKSRGGDFDRKGFSENYGPELGCVKWTFETGGAVSASVTIGAEDRLHIGCEDGRLYTLNAGGLLLWSCDVNSPIISSPTVGPDGTVFVGTEAGRLYAVDMAGDVRWTHDAEGFIYSSPAVSPDGNSVYVGSKEGVLYALAQDGSEQWRFELYGSGVIDGSILASPAIGADGTVYIGGLYDPNLYALDANDGSVKWACNFEYPANAYFPDGDMESGWPFASPVVAPDGSIYQTLLFDPNLYAIEPNTGNIIWWTQVAERPGIWSLYEPIRGDADGWAEPALGPDGTIYVSFNDSNLTAIEPNGAIKWATRLGMTEGFTLTVGSDGLIYAAGNDGYLCVVDPNGLELARFSSGGWLNCPVIAQDNTIIVADVNNKVWAITGAGCGEGPFMLHRPEDVDASLSVNFADFALLAADWLACNDALPPCEAPYWDGTYFIGDVDRDLYVDFDDVARLAWRWLDYDDMSEPNCWDISECGGQSFGDGTCDGAVDFGDLGQLDRAFFTCKGQADYNCCADYNHDDCCNFVDIGILKASFFTSGYEPATGSQGCPP
ncbi:MAG TPA: PQQ-binding-like beta-propeller repeat protein [Sedimentisphaerales bacterium]|nr:PQQ-binding-like beta-propeller repeat protein [Sedimentisphaerales bacterium]